MLGFIQLRALTLSLVVVAFCAAGCSKTQDQKGPVPTVSFMTLKSETQPLYTEFAGRTSALLVAEVRPQVGGIILKRMFEEGGKVTAGDTLYQIDPALYEATLLTAEANLKRAQANSISANLLAQRYGELIRSRAVSRQEYDNAIAAQAQAKAEVAAAEAAVETAKINLNYTKVICPISGTIGRSFVTEGALVTPSQPNALAVVQSLDTMYVDLTQSSTELLRLKKAVEENRVRQSSLHGASATLILPDNTEYGEKGEILFADVTVDPQTGAYLVRAKFDNKNGLLMPNLYVRVRVQTAVSENAILIPQSTLAYDIRGNAFVRVLVPAQFKKPTDRPPVPADVMLYNIVQRPVKVERSIGNQWLISEGLHETDMLVFEGVSKLFPGQDVVQAVKVDPSAAGNQPQAGA